MLAGERLSKSLQQYIDASVAKIKTIPTPIYNVQGYEAVGDGVTDDTTFLQNTINAAITAGKKVVHIPDGTYLYSTLTINSSLTIKSFGGNAVLKQKQHDGNGIVITGTGTKVVFDGITFDGNNSAQVAESTNTIIYSTATGTEANPFELKIVNCKFVNQAYASIQIFGDFNQSGQERLIVQNCTFVGGNDGNDFSYDPRYISINDAADAIIENNYFERASTGYMNGIAGVVTASTDSAQEKYGTVTIKDNEFHYVGRNATNDLGTIDYYIYAESVYIEGNKIYNAPAAAIKGKSNSKHVSIKSNFIYDCSSASIVVNASTTSISNGDFLIEGNFIVNSSLDAISVDSLAGDYLEHLNIKNNVIINPSRRAFYILRTRDINLSGNMVDTTGLTGVEFNTCDGMITMSENQFRDTGNYPIYLDTGCETVRFSANGNQITNPGNGIGMYFDNVDHVLLEGNTIEGNGSGKGFHVQNVNTLIVVGNIAENLATPLFTLNISKIQENNNSWNPKVYYGTSAPASGTWAVGDRVINTNTTAGGNIGWVCVSAGTPGTWKTYGTIQA